MKILTFTITLTLKQQSYFTQDTPEYNDVSSS